MAKAAYRMKVTKRRTEQNRLQGVAQKMAPMQKCVQELVQNGLQILVQIAVRSSVHMVVQKNGSVAETMQSLAQRRWTEKKVAMQIDVQKKCRMQDRNRTHSVQN